MRIQHNIMAMNAYRNYTNNANSLSSNLEKLSSGYRINRAGDDAAGLAISEKMRAQITGLDAAQKNVQDGVSLVKTAEGALQEVQDMLNRMVYLATQSANGTYEDEVDRENLQAEVDQLRSEINRIADSANFNGRKLLDGSLAAATGVEIGTFTANNVAAVTSNAMGVEDASKTVDGALTAPQAEVSYEAKFYVGDIVNNAASTGADATIKVTYKDNTGTEKVATFTLAKGTTGGAKLTAAGIQDALADGTLTTTTGVTYSDAGTAMDGTAGKGGQFHQLYTATLDGNVLTIKAKGVNGTTVGTVDKLAGDKLGITSIAADGFETADLNAAQDAIKEDYAADGTAAAITYGSAAGTATTYVAKTTGEYKVASEVLTISQGIADLHNSAIKVGDKTYVLKDETKKLEGAPEDAIVVSVDSSADESDIATALAQAISKSEGTNGNYVATAAAGVLTVSESTNRAADVLAGDEEVGKGASIITLTTLTKSAADTTYNGEITIDAASLTNGTSIEVGDHTFVLTNDENLTVSGGDVKVSYSPAADSAEIAKALAEAMTNAGIDGVANNDTKVVFTATSNEAYGKGVSAIGTGLQLQIGDTSDYYNQLSVAVKDMHTAAMVDETGASIATIDITSQPNAAIAVDVIKNAINYVSSQRGDLGAIQNRLEHTANNLSVMEENITNAESAIRDTDIADEMTAYTKNNILLQSAQAMLAQANQVPQGVLQLLQ